LEVLVLRLLPLLTLAAAALAARSSAAAEPFLRLDDPPADAYGPGGYLPPTSNEFQDGDFDLQRFEVLLEGDEVVFEVTLGASIRQPQVSVRDGSAEVQLWNGIYLQNVDIYIDTDPASREGRSDGIPGRRVAFAQGRTWKRAIVLTPQPGAARSLLEAAFGRDASHVIFVEGIHSRGRTLVARVPVMALGGVPKRSWGWSVQISGARWQRSFTLVDRVRGTREVDCLTLPVQSVPDSWAFGGAPSGEIHPRVLDVLLPPGVDQRRVLGSYDELSGAFARIPFVYPEEPASSAGGVLVPARPLQLTLPAGAAPTEPPKSLVVADLLGDLVSIAGPVAGLKPMQFGQVLGEDGQTVVAHLIITQVMEGGVLAKPIASRAAIVRGARVVFEPPR
jgi:C-terminal binding-module, SLH-like, of glucodextranase